MRGNEWNATSMKSQRPTLHWTITMHVFVHEIANIYTENVHFITGWSREKKKSNNMDGMSLNRNSQRLLRWSSKMHAKRCRLDSKGQKFDGKIVYFNKMLLYRYRNIIKNWKHLQINHNPLEFTLKLMRKPMIYPNNNNKTERMS